MGAEATTATSTGRPERGPARQRRAALLLGYAAIGFAIYSPCLPGPPVSDDYGLLLNPWVIDLSAQHTLELLDPRSQATLVLRNYAPVRPLIQELEWHWFGQNTQPGILMRMFGVDDPAPAYHAVNVAVHALTAWLLALLLAQAGLPLAAAALGGALFLVHPAAVEAVAWMSQIWGPVGLGFGVGALLLQRRRPAAALALFALALLSRPTAVCFLPVAMLREWSWRREAQGRRWVWMLGWLVVFAALSAAELRVFRDSGAAAQSPLHPDPLVHARSVVASAGRYAAMALTGHGVGAFQEPGPALSWLDPWWLLGVATTTAIGARALVCLRRGREEAAWWAWAPAAFLPVSQLFPFLYPMADRYLYFMLPGLIGGVGLAGQDLGARIGDAGRRRLAAGAATALAVGAIAGFGVWSHARAALWLSEDRVLADAAAHSPEGVIAHLLRARRSAAAGDVEQAVAALGFCRARGWDYYGYLQLHPAFEPVRSAPAFQALIARFADDRIAAAGRRGRLTQLDLRDLAEAYELRGRSAEAMAALERALALGGPLDPELRTQLAKLRARAGREPAAILAPNPEEP